MADPHGCSSRASATCAKKNGKTVKSPLIVAYFFRPLPRPGGCYLPSQLPHV
ncbi:hypothetical protein KCP76_14365 [Salmonella enterica subsp. enterica serovar Weltevreden]|nr:hypothetical protein KCP76_14365 [Salmonella enterica subsp. enterica serovar Weltevreden]